MNYNFGPVATRLLSTWGNVAALHPNGPGYDLTSPTRSEQYRRRLATFIADPTESNFEALWDDQILTSAAEWHTATVRKFWSSSLADLATFFDEIRTGTQYNDDWRQQVYWGSAIPELYTRSKSELPIVSEQSSRGLRKFGEAPATGFDERREQLLKFRKVYLDTAGHVTATNDESIPVYEEIDQLFRLVTTVTDDDITTELDGPRSDLYRALRGYPAPSSTDRGPIEIDFDAATPAIDGHIAARQNNAYADLETEHWAGKHYETWKWDFADYVSNHVATTYPLGSISADELEPFFDDFWANADTYTDTTKLTTPVPRYLLGRWGVVQFEDFRQMFLKDSEEAARVLSTLFLEDEHVVTRLQQFHNFAACDEVTDGNLLRIATTFLMGVYPNKYVNFQYERFETFFSECSNVESLETGFDARQYYRIVLACRDLRDAMQEELPDASMLDVHTLIRLYQDFQDDHLS